MPPKLEFDRFGVVRLPAVLQARLASKIGLTDENLREAVVEACALVDEELLGKGNNYCIDS